MIFKESLLSCSDSSGVGLSKTIHLYKQGFFGFLRNGKYLNSAVKVLSSLPPSISGRSFSPISSGFVVSSFLVKVAAPNQMGAVFTNNAFKNSSTLINRNGQLSSKHLLGTIMRPSSSNSFWLNFNKIL